MTWQNFIDALPVAVPAFLLTLFQFLRARKVDSAAERSGVAANGRAGTAQLIKGFQDLVDDLQKENRAYRKEVLVVTSERDTLRLEVANLRKQYGVSG